MTVPTIALAIALTGAFASATPQPTPFEASLALYRSGQTTRAIAEVKRGSLSQDYLEEVDDWTSAARRLGRRSEIEAALLLHTEIALEVLSASRAQSERTLAPGWLTRHLERVHDLRKALTTLDRHSPFLLTWYLLWESFLQAQNMRQMWPHADFLSEALDAFPENPEVLLIAGSRYEMLWWAAIDNPQRRPAARGSSGEGFLRSARDWFRKSAAAGPAPMDEARLRLGRVLVLLGEYEAAAASLESVRASSREPPLIYLANLFLGDLYERRGDAGAAAAAYQAAVHLVPVAQSAQLAAARLAHGDGATKPAADMVIRALSNESKAADPWWWYFCGQAWQFKPLLERAHKMVRT